MVLGGWAHLVYRHPVLDAPRRTLPRLRVSRSCGAFCYRPPTLQKLFLRMFVGGRCVFVPGSAMFVSSLSMLFRLFVLTEIMMVGRLVMMVGGGVMISGGLMMVLTGRMLR